MTSYAVYDTSLDRTFFCFRVLSKKKSDTANAKQGAPFPERPSGNPYYEEENLSKAVPKALIVA